MRLSLVPSWRFRSAALAVTMSRMLPVSSTLSVGATELRIARATAAFARELDGGQRRVLADVLRGNLVRADAGVRLLADRRMHAGEPRARDDRVRARAFAGLV